MAILSRLGARGGGEWESASICSSATVGSLNKIWKNAQTSDFLNNRIFIIWNLDVNCEKLVFLVLNIAKHIFLAVLYFLAAGSRKAAQMHSDPVNSLMLGIVEKIKVCFSSSHPSESTFSSGGLSAFYQPNSINVFYSGICLKSAFCISCSDKINAKGQT